MQIFIEMNNFMSCKSRDADSIIGFEKHYKLDFSQACTSFLKKNLQYYMHNRASSF